MEPFPEHYEAVEAPCDKPLHPDVSANPVAKKFASDKDAVRQREDFRSSWHDVRA